MRLHKRNTARPEEQSPVVAALSRIAALDAVQTTEGGTVAVAEETIDLDAHGESQADDVADEETRLAPVAVTGVVLFADEALVQIADADGSMEFYYPDQATAVPVNLPWAELEGRTVTLTVSDDNMIDVVAVAGYESRPAKASRTRPIKRGFKRQALANTR